MFHVHLENTHSEVVGCSGLCQLGHICSLVFKWSIALRTFLSIPLEQSYNSLPLLTSFLCATDIYFSSICCITHKTALLLLNSQYPCIFIHVFKLLLFIPYCNCILQSETIFLQSKEAPLILIVMWVYWRWLFPVYVCLKISSFHFF